MDLAYSSRLQFIIEEVRQELKSIKFSQNQRKNKYILSCLLHCSRPLVQRMVPSTVGLVFYINNQDNCHR